MSARHILGTRLRIVQPLSHLAAWNAQRTFHSSSILADRPNYRQQLREVNPETEVDAKLLLDSIKDIQAHKLIVPQTVTGHTLALKDAHRTLSQLMHDKKDANTITLGELQAVISPTSSAFWLLVVDLMKDGQSSILAKMSEVQRAKLLFARVHGIGPKFAEAFTAGGARTLGDLYKSEGSEYGKVVSPRQKLAIEHFDDMERLIPRAEVEEIKERFKDVLDKVGPKYKFEVMGSYRRGELFSSDVDIVVHHPSFYTMYGEGKEAMLQKITGDELFNNLVEKLFEIGFLFKDKVFSNGAKKVIALTRNGTGPWRQVDIRICPTDSLPYMLVGNTGDSQLMKILRVKARRQGLVMNEYTMGKAMTNKEGYNTTKFIEGTHVPAKTERDIFKTLGMPYLEPEDRSFRKYKEIRQYAGPLQFDLD